MNSISSIRTGSITSTKSSPGLLIATGNEGEYLRKDVVNTYLSYDAGMTWRRLAKGNHIYELGDQGGLIVMGEAGVLTNTVKFSYDMGLTFNQMKINEKLFFITSIKADPQRKGVFFTVSGLMDGKDDLGVVIPLDFSMLMPRRCDVANLTDFEEWVPAIPNGE